MSETQSIVILSMAKDQFAHEHSCKSWKSLHATRSFATAQQLYLKKCIFKMEWALYFATAFAFE